MTTFVDRNRSDFNYSNLYDPFDPFAHGGSFGDILWRDKAGDTVLWTMIDNLPSTITALPSVTPDWHIKAAANFDTVGLVAHSPLVDADILWQNDNGALVLWQMAGATVTAVHALPNPGPTWHVVGDNDFGGDVGTLRDEILFQNDNGTLAMWTGIDPATGTVSGIFAATQNPGPTWHVAATGDPGGDGVADILLEDNNGALALWQNAKFGAGTFTFNTVTGLPAIDLTWHVKGIGYLNPNPDVDFFKDAIVFQNDNGAVAVWEMDGASITAVNLININPGPSWHIVGLRDMNYDERADVLWQNDNGAAAVWENYQPLGGGSATFTAVLPVNPNPNPNAHVWDLL